MQKRTLRAPSPALAVSLLALFVALGGTSYAAIKLPANSVGTKQLKANAVTGAKIANGAVSAAKIDTSGLIAPNATHAISADSATSATSAANATHATSADSATNAGHATSADSAINAGHATSADSATNATNADQLGGIASSGYQRTTLQSGKTETGTWAMSGYAPDNSYAITDAVTFPVPLAASIDAANAILIPAGTSSVTHCPGVGQADAGYLCLYQLQQSNTGFSYIYNPSTTGVGGASPFGFVIEFFLGTGGGAYAYGEWSVTAP